MSVFIGSIPNTERDDLELAKRILKGQEDLKGSLDNLRGDLFDLLKQNENFANISDENIFLFNRGRDSIFFYLNALELNEGDEIIVQAFTCVAVVAPILWNNLKPVYVDIDPKTYNMDLPLLQKNITDKTKAIVIQHTFGNLANMRMVREIVDEANKEREEKDKIKIIEDSAHIFPSDFKGRYSILGKYSDMLLFSFSQDKSISSTQGAASIILDENALDTAKENYSELHKPSKKESLYNARYIKLWSLIKKYYFTKVIPFTNITVGRILIILFRNLGLIRKQAKANTTEFSGIEKLSQVQAVLLSNQLQKVSKINQKREKISRFYDKNLKENFRFDSEGNLLLRYPILLENKRETKEKLLEKEIIAGNWYSSPVHPLSKEDLGKVDYSPGSCPIAEKAGESILNLPTNIEVTDENAREIVEIVNNFAKPFNI
jgi:dTDP-4-amino-4,6-dideoxygalactose transaminase